MRGWQSQLLIHLGALGVTCGLNVGRKIEATMKLAQVVLVLIPFFSLFTIHVLGFTAHSGFALLGVLSKGMIAGLMWAFFSCVVFSFLMARLVVYLGRGILFRFLALLVLKVSAMERFRVYFRWLSVILVRDKSASLCLVGVISLFFFNHIYLGAGWFQSLLLCFVPIMVFVFYMNSEEGLLVAANFLRGSRRAKLYLSFRGFLPGQTSTEVQVSKLLNVRMFRKPSNVILIVLLVASYSSYSFGKIRSEYLRGDKVFSWAEAEELSYMAGDGQYIIFWDSQAQEYRVVSILSEKEIRISIPVDGK
ncbi:hypothetical protein K4K95_11705 [Phaeobacter inhibens]|uniref:hypothetical protein n=1 Tax=Phaeobacter inhibens TaxID=221822 RepID=UPI0021A73C9A|nr:hypothetical protein [Phaeobacter inhibens]UWR67412.1 hypothetical protein K4K95_11705 [Phaeobacter inhibens]